LIILVIITGIVYESRTTILLAFISIFLIAIKPSQDLRVRARFVIPFAMILFVSSFFGSTFVSNYEEKNIIGKRMENMDGQALEKYTKYFNDIRDSIFILYKGRESDNDRRDHLYCASRILLKRENVVFYFGSGSDSHKYVIEECQEFGGKNNFNANYDDFTMGSRSTTFTALLVDYGAVGAFLLALAFLHNLLLQLIRKSWYNFILIILVTYFIFLANVSSMIIVWSLMLSSWRISVTDKI